MAKEATFVPRHALAMSLARRRPGAAALDLRHRHVLGWATLPQSDLASQLAREHADALMAFAMTLSGDPTEASDLVQDTFERALKRLDTFQPETNARGWLCTILHNLFVDRWRSRAARPQHDHLDDHERTLAQPEAEALPAWANVSGEEMWSCVARLDDELREIYQLYAADGLSYQEIAASLGVPVNTVGTRIHRARRKLRELLLSPRAEGVE